MFKLFRNLKPMRLILFFVFILVASQSIAELFLPQKMSEIIDDGLFVEYELAYEHETMPKPDNIAGIESNINGYDNDTIPVFEMQDGFSTYDLKEALMKIDSDVNPKITFQNIPVKDSKQLFNDVLTPFLDGLDPYQGKKYNDVSPEIQKEIRDAINRLIVFDTLPAEGSITVDSFLSIKDSTNQDEETDIMSNSFSRKILTACFIKMKHSEYGNILPIPIDSQGKRIPVDANGQALDKTLLNYNKFYNEDTERIDPLPDYELILCNKVLGYAYKFKDGQKWINHKLGVTEETAQTMADEYNKINNIDAHPTNRILEYLTLSPQGGLARKEQDKLRIRTAKDMMMPDGETFQKADMVFILKRGGTMLLLTLLACSCAVVASLFSAKIAGAFSAKIRSDVFRKVEGYGLVEFDKFSTASLITRSTNDINQIQSVFLLLLRTALSAPITVIGGLILSLEKSTAMTAVLIYPFPILFIASAVAAKVVYPLFDLIQTKVDRLTTIMREGLTGIRVVRAFNQQQRERDRFAKTNAVLTKIAIKVNKYCALLVPLIAIVMNCTMIGVIWVASNSIANNEGVDVGDMMAVIQYITLIMTAMVMLATVFVMFPRAAASAKRINEVLETEVKIKDSPTPISPRAEDSGSIEFRNVNFKYSQDAENYVLENISFRAEKGKVLAIVGGTGSGKSSIINLIPRFYDVIEGDVIIDGVNVKDVPQLELRYKIGFIPQRSVLFSGTIRENLKYGKEDATEAELWDALKIAQSDTFVKDKEAGLDSIVEQGGNNFSGGQKQRLAIARALVRRPEILIFDDSFSALDFKTDSRLRKALKTITSETATIIVAQRIGTIMDADNIIVLDNGKIVGSGVHSDLIKNCQIYRDIALSQMSEEELGL